MGPEPSPFRMGPAAFRIAMRDVLLRRELNTALWIEPLVNRGAFDAGWNCRDHAWVTALLACCTGLPGIVFRGGATFISKYGGVSMAVAVPNHAWAAVDRVGYVDLS